MPTVLPLSCFKIEPMIRFSTLALLSLLVSFGLSFTQAQSEIEVFSEVGDAFSPYPQPSPNERRTRSPGLGHSGPRVRPTANRLCGGNLVVNVYKNNFGAEAGMRSTGKITLNRKGQFLMVRAFGFAPMSSTPKQPEPTATAPAVSNSGMQSNVSLSATGGVQPPRIKST